MHTSHATPESSPRISLSTATTEVLLELKAKLTRKHGALMSSIDNWPDNLRACYSKRGYMQLWRLFAEKDEPWQEGCCANGLPERKLLFCLPLDNGYIVVYKEAGFTIKQMADVFLLKDGALGFRGSVELTGPVSGTTLSDDLQRSIDETLRRRRQR